MTFFSACLPASSVQTRTSHCHRKHLSLHSAGAGTRQNVKRDIGIKKFHSRLNSNEKNSSPCCSNSSCVYFGRYTELRRWDPATRIFILGCQCKCSKTQTVFPSEAIRQLRKKNFEQSATLETFISWVVQRFCFWLRACNSLNRRKILLALQWIVCQMQIKHMQKNLALKRRRRLRKRLPTISSRPFGTCYSPVSWCTCFLPIWKCSHPAVEHTGVSTLPHLHLVVSSS